MSLSRIGLIGFGTVGQAFYAQCQAIPELEVTKVCVRRLKKKRGIKLDKSILVKDVREILTDSRIDLVVELIDDAEVAFSVAKQAMEAGKPLITANKRMLAENLQELLDFKRRYGSTIYCEASVAASIPIIDTLCSHYGAGKIDSLQGILNGSCNFILGKVAEGIPYPTAVGDAQRAGFAESDPSLDVEGWDATFKTSLLAYFAFGQVVEPKRITRLGISDVKPEDIAFARSRGGSLKLVGHIKRDGAEVDSWVGPSIVQGPIASVTEEYNGVELHSAQGGVHFLSGKGAGGEATALAVVSDCLKAHRRIKTETHWPIRWRNRKISSQILSVVIRTASDKSPKGNWLADPILEKKINDHVYWSVKTDRQELDAFLRERRKGEMVIFLS